MSPRIKNAPEFHSRDGYHLSGISDFRLSWPFVPLKAIQDGSGTYKLVVTGSSASNNSGWILNQRGRSKFTSIARWAAFA